jgi:membrane protein
MPLFSRHKQDDERDVRSGRRDDARGGDGLPDEQRLAPDDPRKPDSPTELDKRTWLGVAKRAFKEFKHDNITDWAAALTYYAVLSIFPALIVFVSLLGLFGQGADTVQKLLDIVRDIGAPPSAVDALSGPIEDVVDQQAATAGITLVLGLLGALWSASGYVGAFMRASNAIYEVREGRKFYILRPLQILITIVGVLLLTLITLMLVTSGPVAQAIGDAIGLGDTAVTVWNIAKWPIIVVLVSLMIAALYHIAPNVQQPRFRWFTLGGFLALLLWVIASVAFGLYVANFGSYNKTYGSLGAVITFLVWLWITNNVILFGA